jgi:ATP synthase F1 complex assembly factor 1
MSSSRKIAVSASKMSPEAKAASMRIIDMEEQLASNPYFAKYMPQLESLKQHDPVEYLRRLDKLSEATIAQAAAMKQRAKAAEDEKNGKESEDTETTENPDSMEALDKSLSGKTKAPSGLPYDLNKILKVELMKEKTTQEVSEIWKTYFAQVDSICAVVPKKKYVQIHTLATVCPQFVYPVPRDDGYEFFVGEWKGDMLFFTSLVHYQKHGENAPIAISMHHYTDLQESHGIVLMASKVSSEHCAIQDAQFLAYAVELFYGTDEGKLVKQFRFKPTEFNFNDTITRIEELIQGTTGGLKEEAEKQ